jgi:hypothetical protein
MGAGAEAGTPAVADAPEAAADEAGAANKEEVEEEMPTVEAKSPLQLLLEARWSTPCLRSTCTRKGHTRKTAILTPAA